MPNRIGVKLNYQGNVLYASSQRSTEENLKLAKIALIALIGYNPFVPMSGRYGGKIEFDEFGGKIETYSSY